MSLQPPPQPGDAVAAVPSTKPHVLGIIALVVAVVGLIFACIPGALVVGWILLPIGFVLSIVALFLKGAKWPAVVGVTIAVVGTVVGFVVFFAVVVNAASEAFGVSDRPAGPAASSTPEKAGGSAPVAGDTVVINGATQTTDYQGKPVLVVDFTFTNTTDRDASFTFSAVPKAFQGGIELESAILRDLADGERNALKEIKPGLSIDVQRSYLLSDTSDVTVEVEDLFNFTNELIATKTFTVQ